MSSKHDTGQAQHTMQAGQACYEENLTLRTLHASRTAHR